MHDIKKIRNDPKDFDLQLKKRMISPLSSKILEIDTKNGKVKVLGPGAIHDNFIPDVNKMPELDEHGKMIRTEFSSI